MEMNERGRYAQNNVVLHNMQMRACFHMQEAIRHLREAKQRKSYSKRLNGIISLVEDLSQTMHHAAVDMTESAMRAREALWDVNQKSDTAAPQEGGE